MRKSILAASAIAAFWCSPALAGGAFCTPDWRSENADLGCTSQIAIAPGNDSRVNLFLLLQDRAGNDGAGLNYPDLGWRSFYGRNFLRWQNLREAWLPPQDKDSDVYGHGYGDRCQTNDSGKRAFIDALEQSQALGPASRDLLKQSRERIDRACADGPGGWQLPAEGGPMLDTRSTGLTNASTGYMAYVVGSASFYGGQWARATDSYRAIADAKLGDDWLDQTSRYMIARTALNHAIDGANDKWGYFELGIVDKSVAARAELGFREYLSRYPDGLYAASADGLIRKALWLQRDYARLGAIYGEQIEQVDPSSDAAALLVEELDDKWLIREGRGPATHPLILAADDLMRMRSFQYEEFGERPLSAEELDGQAATFADYPQLYSFLKANHAFYVAKDYRKARDLLPDDARQASYSPLAFSRQYLRGLALHALKDPNEESFWRELIGGAKGIWQRPAVELALARVLQQKGDLDAIFAEDSPIRDARIRRILLGQSAGPDILKGQARSDRAHPSERAFATFTVLLKQLQHGQYRGFGDDLALADSWTTDPEASLWNLYEVETPPLQIFTDGKWADGYACPSIGETAKRLAADSRDVKGRLCLGDFYRLNGFDDFQFGYDAIEDNAPAVLGERSFYPGKTAPRHDFYTSIMADRSASRDDRAYALFRAIRCYAPANANGCGGEGVDKQQRAAWFRRIKQDYGDTRWARQLDYYW